jgi:hypothetical protein
VLLHAENHHHVQKYPEELLYAKNWLVHEQPTPLSAKQIEDEKSKTSSGIYEQVFKNAVVKKDTTDAIGGFNLNYNEEIEVKSAEFQDPICNEGFYLNKNGIHENIKRFC